ncbi:polysaccharide deacetylase family protein [bacterium]|nr:polysaccharide deacetylase family protein [bacterium]
MTKSVLLLSMTLASTLLISACTHSPSTPISEQRVPASEELSQAEKNELSDVVLKKNSNRLKQLFVKTRIAQTMIASFDARIAKINKAEDMDKLLESNLYCKVWQVRTASEHTDEQLLHVMKSAKANNRADWVYSEISAFAKQELLSEAAMLNMFRGFINDEQEICGRANCMAEDVSKLRNIRVNPLNQAAMSKFMKDNRGRIAAYANITTNDLKPGACYEQNPNRKPQAAGFDWVNRNWVGSVLPVGSFVITYDDGPHVVHTQAIADSWEQAGLAKPAFFWLRKNASALPDVVQKLNNQGYSIGSHSERHADLGNIAKSTSVEGLNGTNKQALASELKGLSASQFSAWKEQTLNREINQSADDLSTIIGKPLRYFRLPYGSGVRNDLIGARFEAKNLDHFFWRVDSLDWQDKNPQSIFERVTTQMKAVQKGIILFHDIHPQSAAASKLLVEYFRNNPSLKAVPMKDLPGLKD